ncbi:hypothetical protein EGK76_10105 [Luteimonas sp. 100069]|nr:hypothetical protein EGK76_10105 [Luteimonas sp. 100069]
MPASAAQAEAARALVLLPGQAAYAGDFAFNVDNARASADSDAMVIVLGDVVIGFYRLDYVATAAAHQVLDPRTVTLRAFALGAPWQGLGLARPALEACCADLAARHPGRPLALNVHARNHVALALYLGAGFVDGGESLPGGSAGAQRLLLRASGMGQCRP